MKLFIDTWGWLTPRDKKESRHQEVKRFYNQFRSQKGIAYTTNYVLNETFTLLFKRLPLKSAKESLQRINESIEEGYLRLERITLSRFERAKELRLKYRGKPQISFTDLTSIAAMQEEGI